MHDRVIAALLLTVLLLLFAAPTPVAASPPDTGLESLVNAWRAEIGVGLLEGDARLYVAAQDVAGDGTYCPQDQMFAEFLIGGAMYRAGYVDRRGYGLLLCGEFPTAGHVIDWIRPHGGPRHPDLEDMGVVHLAGLDFVRWNGSHVTDVWVLVAADPAN